MVDVLLALRHADGSTDQQYLSIAIIHVRELAVQWAAAIQQTRIT